MEGGSGGNVSYSPYHPQQAPYKYEAGTLHTVNIAGLAGALDYIEKNGMQNLARLALDRIEYAYRELRSIEGVFIYGDFLDQKKIPIISFNIDKVLPSEAGYLYDENYNICLRTGLHCAPLIHAQLGTLPGSSNNNF